MHHTANISLKELSLGVTAEAFRDNPCYTTARAYGIKAAQWAEADKLDRDELTTILTELESWLKGTAQ